MLTETSTFTSYTSKIIFQSIRARIIRTLNIDHILGNEENDTADVKNHVAEVIKQVARFSDLRFDLMITLQNN